MFHKTGWAILAVLVAAILAGCYAREALIVDRVEKKIEAHKRDHPDVPITPELLAKFKAEAAQEEDEERQREKDKAKKNALDGALAVATGRYVEGGLMIGGALLLAFGLTRRASAKAKAQVAADAAARDGKAPGV